MLLAAGCLAIFTAGADDFISGLLIGMHAYVQLSFATREHLGLE
jgi:hypothetical protein